MDNIIQLRAVDRKRLDHLQDRTENPLVREDIWYIHTVLAQCFLPYRDPKTRDWTRKNGNYSIFLTAGLINDPRSPSNLQIVGLPYGESPACSKATSARKLSSSNRPWYPSNAR